MPEPSDELLIITLAQRAVDCWAASPRATTLGEIVFEMEQQQWRNRSDAARQRLAFRRAATAIHQRVGHAILCPGPIVAIVRDTLISADPPPTSESAWPDRR